MNRKFLKHVSKAKKGYNTFVDSEMSMRLGNSLASKFNRRQMALSVHKTAKASYTKSNIMAASIGGVLGTSAVAVGAYHYKKHSDNKKRR
jgi:hypothetical protein